MNMQLTKKTLVLESNIYKKITKISQIKIILWLSNLNNTNMLRYVEILKHVETLKFANI